jgi:16S rRNA (cytosine967-C5)-methyltransferase
LKTVAAISPARQAAFRILLAVERGRAHSDELLRSGAVDALSATDRNLTTALVMDTLRWQILLDHLIRPLLNRPNAKLDAEVMIALRLGAFQILFLDRVPNYAAIDESVELAKQAGHRFAAGMVNAVLRKLAATPRVKLPEGSPPELALAQGHPAWIVQRWAESYGMNAARSICRHGQEQSTSSVRVGSGNVESELETRGIRLESGALLTAARMVVGGDLTAMDAVRDGRVHIQDEGSQLIAELAAHCRAVLAQKTRSILDACAAPGGKTVILSERNPQARIVALEVNERRLEQMRERLKMCASRIECRLADATELSNDLAFDVVLADVPCSGTGTFGRNPEIRHRLQFEDLARHAERQGTILRAAIRAARPGGQIVYSTCSLEPEENEQVVSAVLTENQGVRQISFFPHIDSMKRQGILTTSGATQLYKCLTPQGALQLLPGAMRTDGFFAALIEKNGQ